jgi:hypothetical protein
MNTKLFFSKNKIKMNNSKNIDIDLDDEYLDFSEIPIIDDTEDVQELPTPTLDDYLTLYPQLPISLWERIELFIFSKFYKITLLY